MLLALCEVMERKRVDASTFFRCAYQWRFGKLVDLSSDVLAWKQSQTVPDYVRRYLAHLQGELL